MRSPFNESSKDYCEKVKKKNIKFTKKLNLKEPRLHDEEANL